jgi:hypothetical protein
MKLLYRSPKNQENINTSLIPHLEEVEKGRANRAKA